MVIYLGAGLVVVVAFSILFYKIESESIKDNTFAKICMFAMKISASAIDAQMNGTKFEIPKIKEYEYLLLKQDGKVIEGSIDDSINLNQEEYIKGGCAYYVDKSVRGHMGIDMIIVRDCSFYKKIAKSKEVVTVVAVVAYGF